MPHFFISSEDIKGNFVTISGPLLRHLKGSLRMREGEKVYLVDERQAGYHVVLTEVGRKEIRGEVIGREQGTLPTLDITLAQAIIKGKRMDLVVQKATELGVMEVMPVISERSVVRPTESGDAANLRRWKAIAEEASQQSRRWNIPALHPPVPLLAYLDSAQSFDLAIILWEREGKNTMKDILKKGGRRVCLLVGPEGGFTEIEVKRAREKGFNPVTMGDGTLRSETAAIAAISIMQYELGDSRKVLL